MRKVIGIDLSIACTGIAGNGWADIIPTKGYAKNPRRDPVDEERKRLANHHARLTQIMATLTAETWGADLVVMEGLAFNAYDTDKQSAGLAWIVRHHLQKVGIPYALVPATNLKQYATGDGGASKEDVIKAVDAWCPGILDGIPDKKRDNAADATVLAVMGRDYLCEPVELTPPPVRSALAKAFWPELISDDLPCLEVAA